MKIVVLDGYALNPGDLDWDPIEKFGELTVYERTPVDLIVERCKEANIILTNKTPLKKEAFDKLQNVKLVGVLATGYNIVDIQAAKERDIPVCNVPAYGTASVAQHTFALLLELTNHVGVNAVSVSNGEWVKAKDWSYSKSPIIGLAGKVIGIVGFGNIGQQTARIAEAFGMKIIYNGPNKKNTSVSAEYVSLHELFAKSDFISLHCPLKADNTKFVDAQLLKLMKPSSVLINTSRGQLIEETDLAFALNNNIITGAALDVLSTEPPAADNPLLTAKNCIITPHTAWMAKEARQRILETTANNIQAFINNKPVNVVN